ncbi:imidazole glycerol phosphate synthase subunit HisH [Thiothrix unzii]|uniref:Imidazole glycerol phosphate synthase subunit HisH n=1 Tax=Thiothrix unzii TaxID=111769 RepID=A0A975F8E8_9GAMM|nr:imidazole glycerol phosphate synthase subunit HisH [Thiothrix unzii]QTR52898.1 imidazole glycerol phosphate synthase subunit HisH [Thiothrix unzii]
MQKIAIIDYNMGNLHSVERAVSHAAAGNATVAITSDPDIILKADRVVFPGQGAARDCMRELETRGMAEVVREVIQTKPFLGICMGMQVLMQHSEENGGIECLGLYEGNVRYFGTVHHEIGVRLKIPQMGWNQIWHQVEHPLWQGIADGARFYFVHSYYVEPVTPDLIAGSTEYGISYASAIAKDNVFAIQAHPEKSADDGLKLLENFVNWQP